MKTVTILLTIISAILSFRHGWDAFRPAMPEELKMMTTLGISPNLMPYLGALSISFGLLLLFPQTFFISNLLNAAMILLIIALALRAGDVKTALIEIPFLTLPLLLIWRKSNFQLNLWSWP